MNYKRDWCSRKVRVSIATMNEVKVRAVEEAFRRFCNIGEVIPVKPPSLPSQPAGSLMVYRGALKRALEARRNADFGVGVEAGPIEFYTSTGFIETQIAVIVGPNSRVSVGLSSSFELPQGIVDRVLHGEELAAAVRVPRSGDIGEGIGYIGYLTGGFTTRQDLTLQAVTMALVPWIGGFDSDLMTVEEALEIAGYHGGGRD